MKTRLHLTRFVALTAMLALNASTSLAQQYFKGYLCKGNCSGHIAGYNWAMRHGITDPSQCGGNSQSFYEGCVAYAEGQ